MTAERLKSELGSFSSLWQGGYYFDIDGPQTPDRKLSDVYKACVSPYVVSKSVLEIGPGRGAWTKKMLHDGAENITCLDALSAEHNGFYGYVGNHDKIKYHQVEDFTVKEVEDRSINYVFSFDCFCHISYTGQKEYLTNLRSKLLPGTNCFIMVADADKYRAVRPNSDFCKDTDGVAEDSYDGPPDSGRWQWVGEKRFTDLVKSLGYFIVVPDVGVCPRDVITHFVWAG